MNFYRKPVFFFALFAVLALVTPYAAADETTQAPLSFDKINENIKNTVDGLKKTFESNISPEAKEQIANVVKNFQDTVTNLQKTAGDAIKNSKLDEQFKDFQSKAGEFVKNTQAQFGGSGPKA